MAPDDEHKPWLRSNRYLLMVENMRMLASRASSEETRSQFEKLAILYERLANRAARGVYNEPDAPPLEPYRGINRMPLQETYFPYDRANVTAHAPSIPGIYALWNREVWVYIGETVDIKRRLLEHVSGEGECIASSHVTAFGFEVIDDPVERVARQAALMRHLMPIC